MGIKIGNKLINESEPCFIIAEIGVNHNGSLKLAKRLIDEAKKSGADAVKFQIFKAENLVRVRTKEYEMLKKLELPYSHFEELKRYCEKRKIIFLATSHNDDAIDFLELLVPAYKIGSGDLTNSPFLEKVAKKKKPIILSTGMANLEEIREAIKTIKKAGNNKIILLHCTTSYPCPLEDVNLRAMLTLKKEFNLPVGYSDHTLGILVPIMAVAMGAKVIEKHFTLNKNLPGPDHKASLEPKEFKEMVKAICDVERALGSGVKKPTKNEEKIKKIVRKSIIAKTDIPKGEKIRKEMLIIKRPGTGIEPKYINKIIGKIAKREIKKDSLIKFQDLK
jgi:N-acetylneuraminate synthase/N,N'-diacetyllegionaminate synthase